MNPRKRFESKGENMSYQMENVSEAEDVFRPAAPCRAWADDDVAVPCQRSNSDDYVLGYTTTAK